MVSKEVTQQTVAKKKEKFTGEREMEDNRNAFGEHDGVSNGTGSTEVSSSQLRPVSASVETNLSSSATPIVGSSSSISSSLSTPKPVLWTVASLGDVRKSGPIMLKLMNYTLKGIYNTCNPSSHLFAK